ncbi:glycosyltransferase family 1 protein [Phenylobacterium sp. LjRoot225]|uniref:glycosyltransferase family 4 protein n=1 Tax=Phenylobacterium sp. LjRoot225 TaxID=3342285 RepID=UPI003ECF8FB6
MNDTPQLAAMRIGMMMRGFDEVDGAAIYMRTLFQTVLEIGPRNSYVLFFRDPAQIGRFADLPNVEEVLVPGANKVLWDQIQVPRAARDKNLDVLFHYKFTVPLMTRVPTICQQRGTEYWTHPHLYPSWKDRIDRYYNMAAIPLYCRKARRVLTISDSLAGELNRLAGVPMDKMTTVYPAADARFRPATEADKARLRAQYKLPEEPFFLMVVKGYTRLDEGHQKLSPRKGVQKVLEAYRLAREAGDRLLPLVIVGAGVTDRLTDDMLRPFVDPALVTKPGLISHGDMPALYSAARAMIFPSEYESFGIPLVEAMACGCPIITSTAPACPEVVGDAAILVDPQDAEALRLAMRRLGDDSVADRMGRLSLQRAKRYAWDHSARIFLAECARVVHGSQALAPAIA